MKLDLLLFTPKRNRTRTGSDSSASSASTSASAGTTASTSTTASSVPPSTPTTAKASKSTSAPASPSSPLSPRWRTKPKAHHIECSSGPSPHTHSHLHGDDSLQRLTKLTHSDTFMCSSNGGVDVVRLLHFTRKALLAKALLVEGTALVDEQWTSTICKPRHKSSRPIKVQIKYQGTAAKSKVLDPQRPIAPQNAHGLPGLMTILDRQ